MLGMMFRLFGKKTSKTKAENKEITPEERIKQLHGKIMYILYASLTVNVYAAFFPSLNFLSGVILAVFLFLELFFLSPLGMAVMCIFVSILFFLWPYVVLTIAAIEAISVVLFAVGSVVGFALGGVMITVVGSVITSVEIFMVTAPVMMSAYVGVLTAAAGEAIEEGAIAAIDKVGKSAVRKKRYAIVNFLGCLLVLIVIGWPALSYSNTISGGMACKPAALLQQAHLNHLNLGGNQDYKHDFVWGGDRLFESGFYEEYINNGDNNITQGSKNRIARNGNTFAYIANNVLYIHGDGIDGKYYNYGYKPRETDAMIVAGSKAYVFGYDKVFVAGKKGYYTWKLTEWTSEFEKLSTEEQFEYLYDILERQSTDKKERFSYEEVGTVAYAQRNGLLLDYDRETHGAYFATKDNNGEVTVYLQSNPNQREKLVSFTPTYTGNGLPYTMAGNDGILYLKDNQVVFIDKYSQAEVVTFSHPEENGKADKFISLHYVDLGEQGRYSLYIDEKDQLWLDTRLIGGNTVNSFEWKCENIRISGFAENYIYSIQYDGTLLTRLTYIKDTAQTNGPLMSNFHKVWSESNDYQRIELKKRNFIPD